MTIGGGQTKKKERGRVGYGGLGNRSLSHPFGKKIDVPTEKKKKRGVGTLVKKFRGKKGRQGGGETETPKQPFDAYRPPLGREGYRPNWDAKVEKGRKKKPAKESRREVRGWTTMGLGEK